MVARRTGASPPGWLLPVLLSMLFMYQADTTVVNVALPAVRTSLLASAAELQLVVGGYLLASATLLITGARLGRLYGYRRVFLTGVALFGIASFGCGLATSGLLLVVARFAQGVAGALAFPQVLTGIQVHFEEGMVRNRALALYSVALAGGAVFGQLAGGLLVSADLFGLGWRTVFLVNVPITVGMFTLGLRAIPHDEARDTSRRLDLPGALTLSFAVAMVVAPLSLGREQNWPWWSWTCLIGAAPMLALFVALEQHSLKAGRTPVLNLDLLRRPAIAWGLLPQALAASTYYALLFVQAQYLQVGLGWSAAISGLTLVPWVAAFGVPGRFLNRIPNHVLRQMPWYGCTVMATSYAGLALSTAVGIEPGEWWGALFLTLMAAGGFGLGCNFSAILVHLTTATPSSYAPDISGMFTTSMQIAGSIGIASLGTIYAATQGPAHGYAVITALCALIAMIAGAAGYRATHVTLAAEKEPQPAAANARYGRGRLPTTPPYPSASATPPASRPD